MPSTPTSGRARRLVCSLLAAATVSAVGAQSASASGPNWVNWGSDGNCSLRSALLNYDGWAVRTGADFTCPRWVYVRLTIKRNGSVIYQADTGWKYQKGTLLKDFGACYVGSGYQTVATYWATTPSGSQYSGVISTGSPARLC